MSVYSNSKLSCFETCRLRYKYEYLDKLEKPAEQTVEQFLGSRVHDALEKLYKDLKFQKQNSLEELLGFYNSEWKKGWSSSIILVRKDYSEENYRRMGEHYLSSYYRRYHPFSQSVTLALEHKLSLNLDPEGRYRITGKIDRLSCTDDGTYEIHDYKTSFSITPHSYLETDRQLPLYAIAVKHHYHDARTVRLIWHFLSADKEIVMTKTDEQLESLRKDIMQLIDEIESRSEFPPKKSELCDWCQFRTLCPEWAHIAKTENLPANEYLNEPGVKLVNEYASLSLQRQKFLEEIEPKLERLKEALVSYSEKNRVKVVAGSDHKANIWTAEVVKAPSKNEPGREELEALIKKLGLWHDVSSLDTFTLSTIWKEKRWPEELLKKLEPFLRKEKISRIYLKLKENNGRGSE